MSARYHAAAYSVNEPLNPSWSPEYLSSLRSTFEQRQYTRDAVIGYIYPEPRRIRRQVQGPVEGYHHPNEINGVRILRKGRGTPPQDSNAKEQTTDNEVFPGFSSHRRAKAAAAPLAGSSESSNPDTLSRRVRSNKGCIYPADHLEQLWPDKGRAKTDMPPEHFEQQWPSKGKRIINGRSHMDHGRFFAWHPEAEPSSAVSAVKPEIQKAGQQKCFGKRVTAEHNRSNIILG